jgi:aspartate/methionine/tyrosine aminotransferase
VATSIGSEDVRRTAASPYIEWAKLHSAATWNLATSGVPQASLADLGVAPEHLPLSGPNAYGYAPLLERIAAHHGVDPSMVVTTTGCSMANFLAMAALVEPGDEVLVERPTYEPLLLAAAHLGASIARVDRRAGDGFRLDADAVIEAITPRTRVVVLANLHNPSSQLTPNDSLRRIGEAASRVGARVLVDEVYLDAVFVDHPGTAVHLGPAFLSTSSLTKVYGLSTLRCGWVIADAPLVARIGRLNDLYGNVQPFAMDYLAAAAFDRLPGLHVRTRELLDANRRLFTAWATERSDIAFAATEWGTTVCVHPTRTGAEHLCTELRTKHDVSIVPGRFFELPDHVRISLCTESGVLSGGLSRIAEALGHLGSRFQVGAGL